jgi:hypothetical protein
MANDLNFQNMSTVQNNLQPAPVTVAAAATISPTTFLTIVTGTTAIATITPPVTGTHMLAIVASATNFSGFLTTGNILLASLTNSTVWANRVSLFVYNPLTAKYHPTFATYTTN